METEELDSSRKCSSVQKLCYGLGHVYNDLCAAMWFSYTLFYLQIVLQMESQTAGTLIMIGQVVDSLATPVAGWAVDRTGARRAWHLAGTVSVSVGFSLIFSLKPTTFNIWTIIYYGAVITLFQIGWAVVQISHLSIIPEVSRDHAHSSDLTAIRYTASVCCSIAVYIITLVILKNGTQDLAIGPADYYKFKEIALIITFVGILATLTFYCGTLKKVTEYEEIPSENYDEFSNNGSQTTNGNGKHFLKSTTIYQVSLMYMASRLFTTLNLIYIPLYLDERELNMTTENDGIRQTIASVPLVSFIASFMTSIVMKYRMKCCNDRMAYLIGSITSLTGCFWISMGITPNSNGQIYAIATLIGIGGSSTMVSSLCMTADLVKTSGFGGAKVYGTVTFTDKLISGGVVMIVQNLQCNPRTLCPHFYEHVLAYICGTVAIVGIISLGALTHQMKRRIPQLQ